jgi:hypothetical protein
MVKLQENKNVKLDEGAMNAIVASHRIDADTLRADDFHGFYEARKAALIALVEQAMGKTATGSPAGGAAAVEDFEDDEDELPQEEADRRMDVS